MYEKIPKITLLLLLTGYKTIYPFSHCTKEKRDFLQHSESSHRHPLYQIACRENLIRTEAGGKFTFRGKIPVRRCITDAVLWKRSFAL